MSTKVANIIAIELAALIALLAWQTLSHLPQRPSPSAEVPPELSRNFALLPRSQMLSQPPSAPAWSNNPVLSQPVTQSEPPPTPSYEEEMAEEANPDYVPSESYATESAPYYPTSYQEPFVTQPDYYLPPAAPIMTWPEPASIILVSNTNFVTNHNRRLPRFCDPTRGDTTHPAIGNGSHPPPVRVLAPPIRVVPTPVKAQPAPPIVARPAPPPIITRSAPPPPATSGLVTKRNSSSVPRAAAQKPVRWNP